MNPEHREGNDKRAEFDFREQTLTVPGKQLWDLLHLGSQVTVTVSWYFSLQHHLLRKRDTVLSTTKTSRRCVSQTQVTHTVVLALRGLRQEDRVFKVIRYYRGPRNPVLTPPDTPEKEIYVKEGNSPTLASVAQRLRQQNT